MPVVDEGGVVRFLFTSGVDLTERGPASEELQRLHAELEQQLREQSALRRGATAGGGGPPAPPGVPPRPGGGRAGGGAGGGGGAGLPEGGRAGGPRPPRAP